jgi:hypothetical protein
VPFLQTRSLVLGQLLVSKWLAALAARPADALLTTGTQVQLFTALSHPISPQSTDADFTEATFVGYTAQALDGLTGPINLPSGLAQGLHQEVNFLAGSVVAPGQTAIGYWISGGGDFYAAELFDVPVTFVSSGDFLALDVIFPMGNPANV